MTQPESNSGKPKGDRVLLYGGIIAVVVFGRIGENLGGIPGAILLAGVGTGVWYWLGGMALRSRWFRKDHRTGESDGTE